VDELVYSYDIMVSNYKYQ